MFSQWYHVAIGYLSASKREKPGKQQSDQADQEGQVVFPQPPPPAASIVVFPRPWPLKG